MTEQSNMMMMMMMGSARRAVVMVALLAACGGGGDGDADTSAMADTSSSATAAEVPPAGASASAVDAPITASDLDAYEKGVAREIEVIEGAGRDLAAAKSGTDSLTALGKAMEHETKSAGAQAAGIPIERYRHVTSTVDGWLGGASMDEPLKKQLDESEKSIASLPADQQAAMKTNLEQQRKELETMRTRREESIPEGIREALRTRNPQLDSLRQRLVAARFAMLK